MKKFLKFIICSSMLVAAGAGAAIGLNSLNSSAVKPAEAESLTGTYSKQAEFFRESSSDPASQYILLSNMATTATWGSNTFSNNGNTLTLTLSESYSSHSWHAIYVPFSFGVTIPAFTSVDLSFPCDISTYRDNAKCTADHVAEIQFYDTVTYTDLSSQQFSVNVDNPSTTSKISTGNDDQSGAYRVTKRLNGTESGSHTFTKTLNNNTDTTVTGYVYFGFFGYVEKSSNDHQWRGTLSVTASVTSMEYVASVGTDSSNMVYYENFVSAFNYASNNGGTLNLYKDVSLTTNSFYVNNDLTLLLNGRTLTKTEAGNHFFGVAPGKTFTINGGGGTIKANTNYGVIFTSEGSTLNASNVTIENTQSGSTQCAIQMNNSGNVNLNDGVTLKTDGAAGIYAINGGGVIKCYNTTTITGTGPAIYLYGAATSSENTLYIGGTCNFGNYIQINDTAHANLYSYCNGVSYQGSQIVELQYDILPNVNDTILTMLNNQGGTDAYQKFSVKNAPSYMTIGRSNTDPTKAIYTYVEYSVTINATNVEYGSDTYKATRENNFTITFEGTSDGYYALPSTLTVQIDGVTKSAGTHYTWNQTTGSLVVLKNYITGDINIIISGVATNKKAVSDFVTSYMHMSDYTEELGYCNDNSHHYYATAKQALLNLGADCVNEFRTNDAFTSAHERYLAWAAANHDNNPFAETQGSNSFSIRNTNDAIILILVISTISISFIAMGFVTYKKRKHQ